MGCVQAKSSMNSPHGDGYLEKLKMENGYVGKSPMGHRRSTGQSYNGRETGRVQKSELPLNYNGAFVNGGEEKTSGGHEERDGGGSVGGGVDGSLVNGWPKWLTDNIPREVLAGLVPKSAESYDKIDKILQCLSVQGLTSSGGGSSVTADGGNSSGVSRALVKDRFKVFNIQFEELHQKQSQWTVPDSELRESLRLAVAEVLLPAYRSFVKRFGPLVESGKNPQKYIRYTAEDLEHMLGEFFEGKTLIEPKR